MNMLSQNSYTVLVAEDSEDSREMFKFALEYKGYKVLLAQNGLEAIKIAAREHPDLILMDLMLPKLDGFGTAYSIRKQQGFEDTPLSSSLRTIPKKNAQGRRLAVVQSM